MVRKVFEISHEERCTQRLHILYARRTREKRSFMEDLKTFRKQNTKKRIKEIILSIGPNWYHELSVPQRNALDRLEEAIYTDLMGGVTSKTSEIMKQLGLYPRPNKIDLMNCMYLGSHDPKEMLAQLFLVFNGHAIDGKRMAYSLNGKLILSAILYLGLDDLIGRLRERFRPDTDPAPPPLPHKPKPEPILASPYLQKLETILYSPERKKLAPPPPLPNLDSLNEPMEVEPPAPKFSPPPPPAPPIKHKLPVYYCDQIAGVHKIEPHSSVAEVTMRGVKRTTIPRKKLQVRGSSTSPVKKVYGLCLKRKQINKCKTKPKAPSTGLDNVQYNITGVSIVKGKPVYSLGSVSILPPTGEVIHGGYALVNGEFVMIHCGFRDHTQQEIKEPCDCTEKWHDRIIDYLKKSKCDCGHFYDYGNERSISADTVTYFEKPTQYAPFHFNYDEIFNMDEKSMLIEKEFKKVWDTDSILRIDNCSKNKPEKKKIVKKTKRTPGSCLGDNPKENDYLKCALNLMKRNNIAARLPDIHLVPDLKEWMRRRLHGPLTPDQKAKLQVQSTTNWQILLTMSRKGYGHVKPKKDPKYLGPTDWARKQSLNDSYIKFTKDYRLQMYRSHARFSNMLWPTMCQAQMPDKKFREIYFSYLCSRFEDVHLMHPYNSTEVAERKMTLQRKRYFCPPTGVA